MIDEKSWSWNDLFTFIKFDLKEIVIWIVLVALLVGILNSFFVRGSIQEIHHGLISEWAGEYTRWVVNALLEQGYVTPANLFTDLNRSGAFLIFLFGLFITMCTGFILWRKESVKLWLKVNNKSPEFVLFSTLGLFLIIIAIYVAFVLLSLYVYFLMMRRVVLAELITDTGRLSFRLFSNMSLPILLFWLSFVVLAFGIISVLSLLPQTLSPGIGILLGILYVFTFIITFYWTRIPSWSPAFVIRGFVEFAFYTIGILNSYVISWALLTKKQSAYSQEVLHD